jgi:beta-galactosidase
MPPRNLATWRRLWTFVAHVHNRQPMLPETELLEIALAGDCRGGLIGTVSMDAGQTAVAGATVLVTGTTPAGGWSRMAATDDLGLFQIDLPFGAGDAIDLYATWQNQAGSCRVQIGDLALRLTPRPPLPSAYRLSLEGEWEFAPDADEAAVQSGAASWRTTSVPSHWEMAGHRCETGTAAYRRRVAIPLAWQGKRVRLRADGIYSATTVWLNGRRVGSHLGGATPFELDLSAAARPGETNMLLMIVHSQSAAADLDRMSFYAYWNLAGIWRPLELFAVEAAHIARLALTGDLLPDGREGRLVVDLDLANEGPTPLLDALLDLRLYDPAGREVTPPGLATAISLEPWSARRLVLPALLEAIEPWSAETPALYTLVGNLVVAGQEPARIEQRFGFTRVEITGQIYRFNGQPVKLWGTCHHDIHPLLGRAITPDIVRRDLELIKDTNHNALRTSHYPGHPALVELADEIGLYVEDEAPFCWVGTDMFETSITPPQIASDLRLAPLWLSLTSALLERDRNHPSVCLWSLGNESDYGRNFALAYAFVRRSDPGRPISCGNQREDVDMATWHNPLSMERIVASAALPMPVLFDEAMANFQGAGQSEALELDPGLRDYWVTGHSGTLAAIRGDPQQAGVMIWAWADDLALLPGRDVRYWRTNQQKMTFADRTYKMPGRGMMGDTVWGTVDGWRRPRPEWWHTKKLFSPIHIDEHAPLVVLEGGVLRIAVENRHDFANLHRYACTWRLGQESGVVRADVPPRSRGVLDIATRLPQVLDESLILEFHDGHGRLVDGYRLPLRPPVLPVLSPSGRAARFVDEGVHYLSLANVWRLVGNSVELSFDGSTGECLAGLAACEQVLVAGPALHVMKNETPLEARPTGWQCQRVEHGTEEGWAVLRLDGRYGDDFAGGFEIKMDTAGVVCVSYRFTYQGPELESREVGLRFALPLSCDRLAWERQAEWSYYPPDHIGRPSGSVPAHPPVSQDVPPGERPWGLDDHPWGCNDFRSTKRHIYQASLICPTGQGVEIVSDGTQHIRATLGVHEITLAVLDFYGGAATGYTEWDDVYGQGRPLRTRDKITGRVWLRLLTGAGAER